MRAFLAIALPESVRAALAVLQQDLAQSGADVKWVEPDNLHVTLTFLDEITDKQRSHIEALLRRVASREAPFQLALAHLGAFPSMTAPRVVWVGLGQGADAVKRLAAAMDQEGAALSLRKEERPFAAHITIGRVHSMKQREALVERLRASAWQPPAPWPVASVRLYRSDLSSSGSRYTMLTEAPLSGG